MTLVRGGEYGYQSKSVGTKKSSTKCICLATTTTDEAVTIDLADPNRENWVGREVGLVMTHGHAEGIGPNEVTLFIMTECFRHTSHTISLSKCIQNDSPRGCSFPRRH